MKKFKQLLEFIDKNRGRRDRGDPGREIREFMMKVPFSVKLYSNHSTRGSEETPHDLHFKDMYDASKLVSFNLAKHEDAFKHSYNTKNNKMVDYFMNSTQTHESLLDRMMVDLMLHPKLPSRLKKHVPAVIDEIQKEGEQGLRTTKLLGGDNTQYTIDMHKSTDPSSDIHSHLEDESHHLQGVIRRVKEDPDRGYFVRHEEME